MMAMLTMVGWTEQINLSLIVFNFVLKHRMLLQISKVHYYIDHVYSLGTFPGKGWYWSQLLAFG